MAARAWMVANGERVVETICAETGAPRRAEFVGALLRDRGARVLGRKRAPDYLADEEIESASPFVRGAG